jgi:hypothetical protein
MFAESLHRRFPGLVSVKPARAVYENVSNGLFEEKLIPICNCIKHSVTAIITPYSVRSSPWESFVTFGTTYALRIHLLPTARHLQ